MNVRGLVNRVFKRYRVLLFLRDEAAAPSAQTKHPELPEGGGAQHPAQRLQIGEH